MDSDLTPQGGPEIAFASASVIEAEQPLRKAAADLKASLEILLENFDGSESYAKLMTELDVRMPELYKCYEVYIGTALSTCKEKITCAKGCSHCCSHYVTSVEPYELLFLHGKFRDDAEYASRLISLHRRVSLFRGLLTGGPGDEAEDRALYRYYLRNQPCPFLTSSGACGVYQSRPMSCRMFFSLSHPSLCRGKNVIAPGNRNFIMELPEDIEADLARAGALFTRFALPESLFEGLLGINEVFGRFDQASNLISDCDADHKAD